MPYLSEMCPDELRAAYRDKLALLVPVGAVEFHGGQLPLGTDQIITEGIARRIEKRLPAVVAPSLTFAPTGYAVSGPETGTVDVGVECFSRYGGEVLRNYAEMGFAHIVVIVHHQSENIAALLRAAVLKFSLYDVWKTLGPGWWTAGRQNPAAGRIDILPAALDTGYFPGHGGRGETEAVMALCPKLIRMEHKDTPPGLRWNQSAGQADAGRAAAQMEELLDRWADKIREITGQ